MPQVSEVSWFSTFSCSILLFISLTFLFFYNKMFDYKKVFKFSSDIYKFFFLV